MREGSILAITSKVVSFCEGRILPKGKIDKETLVRQEADKVIQNDRALDKRIVLTLKHNILLPSAGIDESNGNNTYVLYPNDCFASAKSVWTYLRTKYHLSQVGVLITDSRTMPLRRGVVGVALGWWGFGPLWSYIGLPDLNGVPLTMTCINVVDALATSAVYEMGEGDECTPLAIIEEASHVKFDDGIHEEYEIKIPIEEDIYRPLLAPLLE